MPDWGPTGRSEDYLESALAKESRKKYPPQVVLRTEIEWVDGLPCTVYKPLITKDAIKQLAQVSLSLEYNPNLSEESYDGLTVGEVAMIKIGQKAAEGGKDALENIRLLLDYSVGKPKQEIETKSLNLTYQDYLDEIGKSEEKEKMIEMTTNGTANERD